METANLVVGIVGAGGTIAALVVATVIGVREARAFRRDSATRDAERRDAYERQRRAQAECVSAQAEIDPPKYVGQMLGSMPLNNSGSAEVYNASQLPIYECKVGIPNGEGLSIGPVGFVPGGGRGHLHIPKQPDRSLNGKAIEVVFRDSAGNWWHRGVDGELHECGEDPWPRK